MAKVKSKYVTVHSNAVLTELGNVQGPILNPCWITLPDIRKMLLRKRVVYEHAITDYEKRIRLTIKNYDDMTLFRDNSAIEDPSYNGDTFRLSVEELNGKTKNYRPGTIYVQILDD